MRGFTLDVQNDGNLVIYGVGGATWARSSSLSGGSPDETLNAGQAISSPNGTYELIMQTDGNLIIYNHGNPLWDSATSGAGNHAKMQSDGNLVGTTAAPPRRNPVSAASPALHPGPPERRQLVIDSVREHLEPLITRERRCAGRRPRLNARGNRMTYRGNEYQTARGSVLPGLWASWGGERHRQCG